MAEYGNTVGSSSEIIGSGSGGGSIDVGAIMHDVITSLSTLPVEVVLVAAAVVIVGGLAVSWRT